MLYVEREPGAELRPWVRALWYCRAPGLEHARERVLPNGCIQILVNLAGDSLTDCGEDGRDDRQLSGVLVMGARLRYEMVATSDMKELAGVVLEPGGFGRMFRVRADLLAAGGIALDDLWSGSGQRIAARLRESLTRMLREQVRGRRAERSWMVDAAIWQMRRRGMTVRMCARELGASERRLLDVFRAEVGLGPKAWMRVQRFQVAAGALKRGTEVRWAELALDCGYYDQAHFANEFRAFSGLDPTTYVKARGMWQNHLAEV